MSAGFAVSFPPNPAAIFLPINLMTFSQKIRSIQKKKNSLLCIGLDPDRAKLPSVLRRDPNGVYEFCKRIIEETCYVVCAYKLNLAFFEALGGRGWEILAKTIELLPKSVLTIGDGKRGDIGNTGEMYALALFRELRFDAATVNPYMGSDSVAPFLKDPRKGAFVLVLTSNPGARDFQYLKTRRHPLYEHVARQAQSWNALDNCGLVVGATRPGELRRIRTLAPNMPILIPGIGAQGGDLRATVRSGCTRSGDLAIVNVGRAILYASSGRNFAQAAREEAIALRDQMNRYREKFFL